MNHKTVITKLFFLLVNADKNINEKELTLGRQMALLEGISPEEFNSQQQLLKSKATSVLISECLSELKKLDRKLQIRCIAWMCVIANSDGFMDKAEWQFIYRIYHKELQIPLDEIMKMQNELSKMTHQSYPGQSVKYHV